MSEIEGRHTGRNPVKGGMRITEPVAVSDTEERKIVDKWTSICDDALSDLEALGFKVPPQPSFSPEELSEKTLIGTSPEAYAKLYTQHLHWYNYAAPYMAEIKSRLNGVRTAMKDVETHIRDGVRKINKTANRSDKMSEQEIKDKVWLDPRYQTLLEKEAFWEARKDLMASHMDTMDRNMKLISRIEEERKVEFTGERRGGNVGYGQRNPRFRGQ